MTAEQILGMIQKVGEMLSRCIIKINILTSINSFLLVLNDSKSYGKKIYFCLNYIKKQGQFCYNFKMQGPMPPSLHMLMQATIYWCVYIYFNYPIVQKVY